MRFLFGPRGSVLERFLLRRPFLRPACEFGIGEATAYNVAHDVVKAKLVRHGAIVVSKGLLIDVAEQMERLDANVRAFEAAFQKTPEVLAVVGMHVAIDVFNGVVNYLMSELVQAFVRLQSIGVDVRSGFHVVANQLLQFGLATGLGDRGADLAAALQHCGDNRLAFRAGAGDLFGAQFLSLTTL